MAKQGFYWNRGAVAKAIGKVNSDFLFSAGAFVRSRARSSMKKGTEVNGERKPSAPGQSPFRWGNQLYDFMLYAFDPANNSMVIGPKLLGGRKSGKDSTANVLEQGGTVEITYRPPSQPRNRRRWGPAHYAGTRPKLKRRLPDGTEYYRYFRSTEAWKRASDAAGFLSWARSLETSNQPKTIRVHIEPRPFMSKALRQVLSEKVMARLYEKAARKSYR